MPISLAQMAANTATVTFQYAGCDVSVTYAPGLINDAAISALDAGFAERSAELAQLIKAWDVLDDSGNPYPIDADHLGSLDIKFKSALVRAMMGDMRPN